MAELLPGRVPPFEVARGFHPIVDYRYVNAGQPRWVGADGKPIHYWETADPDEIRAEHANVPRGTELRTQPAERSKPFLTCTEPWEYNNGGPAIIRDGGLYRMWYHAIAPDHWDPEISPSLGWGPDWGGFVCYAESDDGYEWRKPDCGQYAWQGQEATNIVFGRELTGEPGIHGESVFLDPQAPAHERFKCFYMGRLSVDVINQWVREQPERVDPWIAEHPDRGFYVATSPDGIKWTAHPEPVVIFISDTMNVVDWNAERQSYVWYSRGWSWDRRTIARAETRDFFCWPLPEPCLTTPPEHLAFTDIYTNGKVTYPGDPSTHLMFPTLYDRALDTTWLAVASSTDDVVWNWVPGGPVLEPGAEGSFDAGCLFSCKGLVELAGDRIGTPYGGNDLPHKYPRQNLQSATAYATWERGRIAGLVAEGEGEFATPQMLLQGREVRLNAKTAADGEVRVTALERGPGWTSRPGHGAWVEMAESRSIQGDHLSVPVDWNGSQALPLSRHGPVTLQFKLRKATLYGFEVCG